MTNPNRSRRRLEYKDAGVDIDQGNEAVRRIRPWALKTHRPEVVAGVGGFAGSFELTKIIAYAEKFWKF